MPECEVAENVRHAQSAPERKIDKRFLNTKTGTIGLHRETMLQNELHINTELGKVKPRGHRLPPQQFTYGIKYEKLDGGVPQAMHHIYDDKSNQEAKYKVIRDFIALNKGAVKSGCTTTKENDQFRSLHDIKKRIQIGGPGIGAGISRKPVEFPDDMIFGQPARPSTPINEVLSHQYLSDWLKRMEERESIRVASQREATKAISGAYNTKASWLKNAKIPVDEKPVWKMPRFRNVEANIDTFQTDFDRKKAFSANVLDRVPRKGINSFQQGVYTVEATSLPKRD